MSKRTKLATALLAALFLLCVIAGGLIKMFSCGMNKNCIPWTVLISFLTFGLGVAGLLWLYEHRSAYLQRKE